VRPRGSVLGNERETAAVTRTSVESRAARAGSETVELWTDTIHSEIGPIVMVMDSVGLCALEFGGGEERMKTALSRRFGSFVLHRGDELGVGARIEDYLAGDLHALDEIKVNPGGTAFQQTVWNALREIPAGTTQTYAQLAASIGRPSAPRAVGLANGQNPVSIVIPCHRLIGSNGALTGYAGGLERKRWLLRHEGARLS
jgi:methylated-DNA-[protein]-cysteine S-methyltransferase